MELFNYLLIGHLIGDFLLQTNWMARHKAHKWGPLLVHCAVYTTTVFAVAFFGGYLLPVGAIVFIFISHVLLDRQTIVLWWVRHVMGVTDPKQGWLAIVVDQIFHLIILAVVAHVWF